MNDQPQYIFYLMPSKKSRQYFFLNNYWQTSSLLLSCGSIKNNEALKYPFHCTLTTFFYVDEKELPKIIETAKLCFNSETLSEKYLFSPIGNIVENLEYYEGLNIIGISLKSTKLRKAIENLTSKFDFIKSKTKDSLHITLAHNYLPEDKKVIYNALNYNLVSKLKLEDWEDSWSIDLWEFKCGKWKKISKIY